MRVTNALWNFVILGTTATHTNTGANMSLCYIKVSETITPIHGDYIGWRARACIPNLAARSQFGVPIPSFAKAYFIAEGSDCITPQEALLSLVSQLSNLNFTKCAFVGKLDDEYDLPCNESETTQPPVLRRNTPTAI